MKQIRRSAVFVPVCAILLASGLASAPSASDWPQFRGPGGSGRSEQSAPVEFGKDKKLVWSCPVPEGHSSPVIIGNAVFLTAVDREARKLSTICIDRANGKSLWKQERQVDKLEQCHNVSNAATASPATDGQIVVSYFSSYGLTAYDFDGKELWTKPLPLAENRMGFGSGTSPVIANGLVLLDVHAGNDSHLLAVRINNGETAWKAANPLLHEGWSTPVVWREDDEDVVGVLNASRFIVRRLKDGSEKWWIPGMPNQTCATPVVGPGTLILTGTGVLGESSELIRPPSFDQMLAKYDSNKDGALATDEIPESLLAVDRKSAGGAGNMSLRQLLGFSNDPKTVYDREKWDKTLSGLNEFLNGDFMTTRAMAVRTGGKGDVSKTAVVWSEAKGVPEIPSPLLLDNRVYLVKSGGLVICRDATTGKTIYEERLGAPGGYYASPVAAGGKIYAASDTGTVVVFEAGDSLHVLARNNLSESIKATPAIVDGALYIRTEKSLYAFK